MRGQPGPAVAVGAADAAGITTGSAGSTSGARAATGGASAAVSHLPQAQRRLPPAGIWAVRPHLQRTVTSSLFMKVLGRDARSVSPTGLRRRTAIAWARRPHRGSTSDPIGGTFVMVRDGANQVTYFLLRARAEN